MPLPAGQAGVTVEQAKTRALVRAFAHAPRSRVAETERGAFERREVERKDVLGWGQRVRNRCP
jgi:hypothetical protein